MKESATRSPQPALPMLFPGVTIDPSSIRAALVRDSGRIVAERAVQTPTRTTRAAIEAVTELLLDLAADQERSGHGIESIGFAVAGRVDPTTGRVTIPELKGWTRLPLLASVEAALDESGHDIRRPKGETRGRAVHSASAHPSMTVVPRAAAMAAGEAWSGAARGRRNVVYLSLGHQVEAGLLVEGRAILGASGAAASVDWLAVRDEFKEEYAAAGCFGTEATLGALPRHAIERWSGSADSVLAGLIKTDPTAVDAAMIVRSAAGGDTLARAAVQESCRWIGRGLANLLSILNPEVILLGGEFGRLLRPHLDDIREEARRWISPETARQSRILSATLGENAALIGAARLAMK